MKESTDTTQAPKLININGDSAYELRLPQQFLKACLEADRKWDIDFKKHISNDYPYTMSPETTQYIAQANKSVKDQMSSYGFQIKSWDKGNIEHEPYVMGVLRRVCVTDTIEPIFDNTDKIVAYLKDLVKNDPTRVLYVRSFFTGAGVAEKCLVTRLHAVGLKNFNLITTDNSAESIGVAAMNLQVWNDTLPQEERYRILIVNGKIKENLYFANRTIVLQVGDALECSEVEKTIKPKFDALLLDNGLPYVDIEYGSSLLVSTCCNMGKDGLFIAALGIDANITVEIDTAFHLQMIVKGCRSDVRKDPRIGVFQAPYNYPHYYEFVVNPDDNILIKKVISDGAGRTYNWLAVLLRTDFPKLLKILKTIKSATNLSRVSDAVLTTPFDTHCSFIQTLDANDFSYVEIEKPLDFEKSGWVKVEENCFSKDGLVVTSKELMDICRKQDPLVLRKSIIKVNHLV